MKFTLWEIPGEDDITLASGEPVAMLDDGSPWNPDAVKVLEFEAEGWDEAEVIAYGHYGIAIEPFKMSHFKLPG